MTVREMTLGDVPVRALRVTYVGELGWELYCPTEHGMTLWRTLWEAGEPHGTRGGRVPRDRLAARREGLPRLGRRHHAGRDALRGRGRLRREGGQGLPRARGTARGEPAQADSAASCSRTRARWRSGTSRCAWTARSPAGSRAAATATRWSARSRTRTCRRSTPSPARRWRSTSSGAGSGARSTSEPLFDPAGERVRGSGVSRPYDEAYEESGAPAAALRAAAGSARRSRRDSPPR